MKREMSIDVYVLRTVGTIGREEERGGVSDRAKVCPLG